MNALARAASTQIPRAAPRVSTRSMSSPSAGFKETWLSDPATYPIIGILSIAVTGCSAFMLNKITTCPDVRVTSSHKGRVIRSH